LSLTSHESLRGKCGIVPRILAIGPKHRWVHAPITLTPEEQVLLLAGGGGGCRAGLRVLENTKVSCTCQNQTPDRSAYSLDHIPITLYLLLCEDSRVIFDENGVHEWAGGRRLLIESNVGGGGGFIHLKPSGNFTQ